MITLPNRLIYHLLRCLVQWKQSIFFSDKNWLNWQENKKKTNSHQLFVVDNLDFLSNSSFDNYYLWCQHWSFWNMSPSGGFSQCSSPVATHFGPFFVCWVGKFFGRFVGEVVVVVVALADFHTHSMILLKLKEYEG